jgi:flagellum-specific ATP synthase
VRSLLDGHIILSRALATKGHYPPIAILDSISRLMPHIVSREHLKKAAEVRASLAAYARSEDLIRIGAYQRGGDAVLDRAVDALVDIDGYLRQGSAEVCSFDDAVQQLLDLPS